MALFKTITDLREHLPARMTFDIQEMLPLCGEIEQEFLAELVLGQDLYDALHAAYQDDPGTPMDDIMADLLEKCRPAVANLAVLHFTGIANVQISSGGLAVSSSDTLKPAAEWRTRDFERSLRRRGYRGLDVLINWLTEHADELPEWEGSEPHALFTQGFLRTTQQFDAIVPIGNGGYVFRKLLPTIRRIEGDTIAAALCSTDQRDVLLQAINDDVLSIEQTKLVKLCRQTTAHLAMADGIVDLSLNIDEHGVWTFASLVGGLTSEGKATAKDAQLNNRIDHHRKLGNHFLQQLKNELQAQAEADETHPYRDTNCYVAPSEDDHDEELFNTDSHVGGFI